MVKIKAGEHMHAIKDNMVYELIADEEMTFTNWKELREYVKDNGKPIRKK